MTPGPPAGEAAPVRMAVVGVGHLGRQHARVVARTPGVTLVGVHDRHAELATYFLEHGLHVLVEKPMASSLPEADVLVALARSRGKILEVGHVERYNPAVEAALSRLGSPLFIEGHRLAAPTARSLDIDVVLDLMIHDLQIVHALVRRPVREVRAAGMPVLTDRVDIANARIEFEGGCVANLTASRVSTEPMRKLRIFAPPLYCSIDMHGRTVSAHRLVRENGRPGVAEEPIPVDPADPLGREIADFASAIRGGSEPVVTGEAGRDALALAERVRDAIVRHRAGAEVPV